MFSTGQSVFLSDGCRVGARRFFGVVLVGGCLVANALADEPASLTPAVGTTSAYSGPLPEVPPPPPPPTDADSRRLIERAQARWEALIRGDFATAYTYETPAFREAHDVESYRGKFGPSVRWHGAEVRQMRRIDEGTAEVGVVLDISFFVPNQSEPIRNQTLAWEQWTKENGDWWHRGRWSNIPGSAGSDSGQ